MAKRRSSGNLDDIYNTLVELPWYIGVAMGIGALIIGPMIAARIATGDLAQVLSPFLKLVFILVALTSFIAAIGSAVKSSARRKLLNQQTGIDSLRSLSWRQFEQLVGEAYRRYGYAVEETGGGGADGGVDLRLTRNKEMVLVQCKRWRTQCVGVDKVRELYGVMMSENATGGILVTVGRFTSDAKSFAQQNSVTLVDGNSLLELVKDIQPESNLHVKTSTMNSSAPACPVCGETMVLRTAKRGKNTGSQFYGCPRFPECRGTLSI
jgi:restriction system protein